MSKSNFNYSLFSSFIIRTPAYPVNFFKNLTLGLVIESDNVKEILKEAKIKEAFFLASPELYDEIQKWIIKDEYPIDKSEKIKFSILKYLTRMSTRATPFGLFATCSVGKFTNRTDIVIEKEMSFYRKTRFDMEFLANLSDELTLNTAIQERLLFYPNTTLYQLGDFYRYIEHHLDQNKRKYSLEALKKTDYLDLILQNAISGTTKKELAAFITCEEISTEEAIEFIEELITNQVLVSELEATLTGDDFFNLIINTLDRISSDNVILPGLKKIRNQLLQIDSIIGNSISCYERIIQTIIQTNFSFNKKHLFQTDLFLKSDDYQLDRKYTDELVTAIKVLDLISEKPKTSLLENFKKAFFERYENQSVSLVKALDVETGIGYLQNNTSFDVSPLLDSIGIKKKTNSDDFQINLNKAEQIICNKLKNALLKNDNSIVLKGCDFEDIDLDEQNLPSTFSCLFEIVEENGAEWIVIQSVGGSSAANLLARFCYGNREINDLVEKITQYEFYELKDKILAEIVHLPESRTGNILRRPTFNTYEIPFLGQSSLPIAFQINIQDIQLFVKDDRLIMWSEKHQKEIIPKLTNAHNYSYNSLPIYHFLCDMQIQNIKSDLSFHWNSLDKIFDYFPRVIIGNCIVSKEKWIFKKVKHQDFYKEMLLRDNFKKKIQSWITHYRLPQYVSLVEGDNTLVLNLKNSTCIDMLIETVKGRELFILEEYLFPSAKVVVSKEGCYANQFIVGIKKEKQ